MVDAIKHLSQLVKMLSVIFTRAARFLNRNYFKSLKLQSINNNDNNYAAKAFRRNTI